MRRSFPMWILSWSMPNYFMAVSKAATEVSPEHKLFCLDDGNISSLELAAEEILEGKWEEIFPEWFAGQGGVLKRPEQTTVLNWITKD